MQPTLLLPLLLTATLTAASPTTLRKRWTCGGEPPAYSCEPAAGCASEVAWGECAYAVLDSCGEPNPDQENPPTECQSSGFSDCETQHC